MVQYNNPLYAAWNNGGLNIAPGAFRGTEYFVDGNTGLDTNNGLDWAHAKLTVASAITASNLTCGNYNMNVIYVNAQTYTESLTTAPKNVNIIGVGAKTRLSGAQAFSATSQNYHFWNIQFRNSSGTYVTIPSTSYGVGFHGCTFEGSGTSTIGISVGGCQDFMLEDCRFLGNPVFTTAIQFTGRQIRSVVQNSVIGATTNGILLDSLTSPGYGNYIIGNVIGRTMTDPNSSAQMTYGIKSEKADGHVGFMMINNRIEAVDGIYFAHTAGTNETDCCIGNICSQVGTGSSEVDYTTP